MQSHDKNWHTAGREERGTEEGGKGEEVQQLFNPTLTLTPHRNPLSFCLCVWMCHCVSMDVCLDVIESQPLTAHTESCNLASFCMHRPIRLMNLAVTVDMQLTFTAVNQYCFLGPKFIKFVLHCGASWH